MRMIHFIDTATSDETIISSDNIHFIQVQSTSVVWVYFKGPASIAGFTDVEFDKVILTGAGVSHTVALKLAEFMSATNPAGGSVLTIKAATAPFTGLTAVAYTTGA